MTTAAMNLLPDYKVQTFFDAIFPDGWKQTEIARILDVDRNTIARWLKDGMPVPKARELVAWKITETIRENAKLAAIMDEFGI